MEKPSAGLTTQQPSSEAAQNGKLPESTTSTPTMAQDPPRCRDFVKEVDEEDSEVHQEKGPMDEEQTDGALEPFDKTEGDAESIGRGVKDDEKASVRHRESVGSFASVPIADQMTVPPAEHIHPQSLSPSTA